MDIARTPTFSKAALPSGCGCDVKTESEGQGIVPWPSGFYILMNKWQCLNVYFLINRLAFARWTSLKIDFVMKIKNFYLAFSFVYMYFIIKYKRY